MGWKHNIRNKLNAIIDLVYDDTSLLGVMGMKKFLKKYGNILAIALYVVYVFSGINPSLTVRLYVAVAFIFGQGIYINRLKRQIDDRE